MPRRSASVPHDGGRVHRAVETLLAQNAEQAESARAGLVDSLSAEQGGVSVAVTKAVSPLLGAASYRRAVKQLLTSVVREICTRVRWEPGRGQRLRPQKRVQRICKSISAMTRRSQTQQDAATPVEALNRKIDGWANYFCLGPVTKPTEPWSNTPAGGFVSGCVCQTQRAGRGDTRFLQKALHQKFEWVRLTARTVSFPWATT
jgi:hypothetical protein